VPIKELFIHLKEFVVMIEQEQGEMVLINILIEFIYFMMGEGFKMKVYFITDGLY
jgi:hypothetical protein